MEKICIFCGRALGRWERKSLYCGNGTQTVCKECYEKYSPMTNVERGLLAWETGRAESREELREFVEQAGRTREEKQEKEREDREQKRTGKTCLRCGGEMLDLGSMKLKLGEETFFFSDWNRLASGSLDVQVLRCEDCGKAEVFGKILRKRLPFG